MGLTTAQQLMLAGQNRDPHEPLYNSAFLFVIDGRIDVAAFRAAFSQLTDDAEPFRTVFDMTGAPVQTVLEAIDYELPVVDLRGEPDPDASAMAWARGRARQRIDIEQTTFDSALLQLGDDRFAWYLNQHHLTTDGKSIELLFRHLEKHYTSIESGSREHIEPIPSFADYVDHESRARATGRAEAASPVTATALYGGVAPATSPRNARVEIELSQSMSDGLQALIDRPGNGALTKDLAWFQLFATATMAFLRRVSDQETITIGAPAHNRVNRRFASAAGLFIEFFPLQVTVDGDTTFATLHERVREATIDYLRAAQPGRSDPDVNRRINVVLNYLNAEFGRFNGHGVTTKWLHPDSVDRHHQLRVQVFDFDGTGRWTLAFDLPTDSFDEQQRAAVAAHFQRILAAMVEDWGQPIDGVQLLNDDERRTILTFASGADMLPEVKDVIALFEERAATTPDAVAMRQGEVSWTYDDLAGLTAQLAQRIEPGSVVGVALPRSAEAVIAMLGSLRAGATYVPIDPTWPLERIRYVLADAGCAMVVADARLDVDTRLVTLDELLSAPPVATDPPPVAADDPAYILYTSGSTGEPKGVLIERGSLANYVGWATSFYGHGLAFPLFTPLTFDLTITSIFVPLVSGGSITVYPATTEAADLAVLDVFAEDAVDIVKLTPSHLSLLVDRDLTGGRIRQLILGGEDLATATAARVHDAMGGDVRIHNEYGPTEATVGCVVHTYDPAEDLDASVPIGRPISGMRAYVLDAGGRPVPFGVPGELWVGGVGLARGYVGKPDMTRSRFRAVAGLDEPRLYATGDRARLRRDGTIEYLGRRDDQVKIKGIRVELGEIEAALVSHPDVKAAAARLWERREPEPDGDLIHCARCGLASDYPGVSFDAERVCNECRSFDEYSQKARVYFKPEGELSDVLTAQRGQRGDYDCIALLSGGKDSSYVLCRLVDMGLRVLALTLDNGYISDQAKSNIGRVVEALGVEHRYLTTPAMNEIFVDSLQRHGNVCNGCFKTIYTLSMQTALEEDIPYIVTGLSRGQFFETRLTADLFTELTVSADQIDANVLEARKAYHRVDDAPHRLLDVSMFEDDAVFDAVQFVDFYRYVDVGLDELYSYLEDRVPWVRPTDTGRSTNCRINDVGIYYHRKFRGFHNYALPYSWDVRLGHKTRADALAELDDDIDIAEVTRMLDEIGFPEDVTGSEAGRTLVAYYTAPVEIPVPQLKKLMAAALPPQLIPARFVRMDAIPLTQNGKVDRASLPSPEHQRPEIESTFIAPRSDEEVILARIWEQILGVDGIGIRDNYFDLGGDSISAVQIIARAHRRGIPITMHQLAEELTIENLVAVVEGGVRRTERVVGPVELTPIQRWFFEEIEDVGHFNHVVRIATGGDPDIDALRNALDALVEHHDALRQTFRFDGESWVSTVAERVPSIPLEVIELEAASVGEVLRDGSPLMAPFDLESAPLMRGAVLTSPDGETELALVAHHLVVDVVSWSHLVDDLGDLTRTPGGELPAVTTSVRGWSEHLSASAPDLEVGLWHEVVDEDAPAWPDPKGDGEQLVGRRTLDGDDTARMLATASESGLGVDEVVLAALSSAVSELMDSARIRVFLEGHGRESDVPEMDVTRTLGWFTSLYPVLVDVSDSSDVIATAARIRDEMAAQVRAGRDYGVLRYLHPDRDVRAGLALDYRAHLVFNYLGRVVHAGAEEGEMVLTEAIRLDRPRRGNRVFGAEVTAYLEDDELVIEWATHSGASALLEAGVARVISLLETSVGTSHAGEGPFPLAGLDEAAMGRLASILASEPEDRPR